MTRKPKRPKPPAVHTQTVYVSSTSAALAVAAALYGRWQQKPSRPKAGEKPFAVSVSATEVRQPHHRPDGGTR